MGMWYSKRKLEAIEGDHRKTHQEAMKETQKKNRKSKKNKENCKRKKELMDIHLLHYTMMKDM